MVRRSVNGAPGHAGALGDVLELAVAEVAVESIPDRWLALALRSFTAVDEKDVQPAVVVKVQKSDTTGGGFNEKPILGLAVEMCPGDAGLEGDVGEEFRGRFFVRIGL